MLAGLDGLRFQHWRAESAADGIVVLSFDRAGESVNTLAQDVLLELDGILERLALDPPKGLVVRSAKPAGFIAGADIHEFAGLRREGHGRRRAAPRAAGVPAAGGTALPHGRRDPRPLHGRRHRTGARLPVSRRVQRSVHPHRPARSEARHLSGLGRQRALAAAGRCAGGVRHDADRPRVVGQAGARRSAWSTRWSNRRCSPTRRSNSRATRHGASVQAARARRG